MSEPANGKREKPKRLTSLRIRKARVEVKDDLLHKLRYVLAVLAANKQRPVVQEPLLRRFLTQMRRVTNLNVYTDVRLRGQEQESNNKTSSVNRRIQWFDCEFLNTGSQREKKEKKKKLGQPTRKIREVDSVYEVARRSS